MKPLHSPLLSAHSYDKVDALQKSLKESIPIKEILKNNELAEEKNLAAFTAAGLYLRTIKLPDYAEILAAALFVC